MGDVGSPPRYNARVRLGPKRVVLSALIVAGGLLAGLLLAACWAAPRVVTTIPTPGGSSVPATTPLRLTFSRPMNRASAEAALSIEPALAGSLRWIENTLVFTPDLPWAAGKDVTFRLKGDVRSSRGLPLLGARSWSFQVGTPRLLYLWPSAGQADLYAATLEGSEPERLTETEHGIREFTVGGFGTLVAYAVVRQDGQVDFRLLDFAADNDRLLYACPQGSQCGSPALSMDGEHLAFELAESRPGPGAEPVKGMRSVYVLPVAGGDAVRVSQADQMATLPVWAPDGKLAYYDGSLRAAVVLSSVDIPPGEVVAYVPNDLGLTGVWSADSSFLVSPEIAFLSEPQAGPTPVSEESEAAFYSHLMRAQVPSLSVTDLSAVSGDLVEDASPALSPDGQWLAFARKYLDQARWTLGRQLWLARPDGTQARLVVDEPAYNHSAFAWSADSRHLAYMRLNQADLGQPPEIHVFDLQTGATRLIQERGFYPQWLP
ncbi:MAG: Ig-like domain-containing protein [Anaerolineales bacterium]|nr:Ig-like domain-containing protein [Anaerolineales bacterium]